MEKNYPSNTATLGKELLKFYPESFTTNFEENKALVRKLIVTDSKALHNEVAGYLTRLKAREASGQTVTVPYISSGNEGRRRRGRTRRR
jgi:small subunit ribosomal protein S17e